MRGQVSVQELSFRCVPMPYSVGFPTRGAVPSIRVNEGKVHWLNRQLAMQQNSSAGTLPRTEGSGLLGTAPAAVPPGSPPAVPTGPARAWDSVPVSVPPGDPSTQTGDDAAGSPSVPQVGPVSYAQPGLLGRRSLPSPTMQRRLSWQWDDVLSPGGSPAGWYPGGLVGDRGLGSGGPAGLPTEGLRGFAGINGSFVMVSPISPFRRERNPNANLNKGNLKLMKAELPATYG